MTNEDMTPRHSKKYSIPSKRMKDDSEHVFKKAFLAHKKGRLAEAEKGYLEVLRRKPDWGQALNALGTVFLDQSRPDKAKKVFEKAADLRPPCFPACYNLARLKQRENDHKGAISIYRAMLEKQPAYDPSDLVLYDKIIGKASALMIIRLGIRKVEGGIVSKPAETAFRNWGVDYSIEKGVDFIDCKTEQILMNITDPEEVYQIIRVRAGLK